MSKRPTSELFAEFIVELAFSFPRALAVMLALGILHNDVWHGVPAIGYWATYVLLWAFGGLVYIAVNSKKPQS